MRVTDLLERWFSRSDHSPKPVDWKAECRELSRLGPRVDADVAAKLSAAFRHRDHRVRVAAGDALHRLGGARAISQLRCREIEAVAAGDRAAALARLREELRDQDWPWSDVDARLAAVAALERISGPDAIELLIVAAREPVSVRRISRHGGTPIDYDTRKAEAVAHDRTVSRAALEGLARLGPQGVEALFGLARTTPTTDIGMRAAGAAARAGNRRGFTLLIEDLGHGSNGAAADELVALAPASVDRLLAMLVGNRQLALGIVSVLGRIADVRAVPEILTLTKRRDRDDAMRAGFRGGRRTV